MTNVSDSDIKTVSEAVEKLRKKLECCLCHQFPNKPRTSRCGHLFCATCVGKLMQKTNPVCSVCCTIITPSTVRKSDHIEKMIDDLKGLVGAIKLDTGVDLAESWSTSKDAKSKEVKAKSSDRRSVAPSEDTSVQDQSGSSVRVRTTKRVRKRNSVGNEVDVAESRSEATSSSAMVIPRKRSTETSLLSRKATGNRLVDNPTPKENLAEVISSLESNEKVNEWLNSEEFSKSIVEDDEEEERNESIVSDPKSKQDLLPLAVKTRRSSAGQGSKETRISPVDPLSRSKEKETWNELALLKKEMRPKTRRKRLDVSVGLPRTSRSSIEPAKREKDDKFPEIQPSDEESDRSEIIPKKVVEATPKKTEPSVASSVRLIGFDSIDVENLNQAQMNEILGVNLDSSKNLTSSPKNTSGKSADSIPLDESSRNQPESTVKSHEKSSPQRFRLSLSRNPTPNETSPRKSTPDSKVDRNRDILAPDKCAFVTSKKLSLKRDLTNALKSSSNVGGDCIKSASLFERSSVATIDCRASVSSSSCSSRRSKVMSIKKLGKLFKPRNRVKFVNLGPMERNLFGNYNDFRATTLVDISHRKKNTLEDIRARNVAIQTESFEIERCARNATKTKTDRREKSSASSSRISRTEVPAPSSRVTLYSPRQDSQLKFLSATSPAVPKIPEVPMQTDAATILEDTGSEEIDQLLARATIDRRASELAQVLLKSDSEGLLGIAEEPTTSSRASKMGLDSSSRLASRTESISKRKPFEEKKLKVDKSVTTISSSSDSEKDASIIINKSLEKRAASRNSPGSVESIGKVVRKLQYSPEVASKTKSPESLKTEKTNSSARKRSYSRIRRRSSSDSDSDLLVSLSPRKSMEIDRNASRQRISGLSEETENYRTKGSLSIKFASNPNTQDSKRKRSPSLESSMDVHRIAKDWCDELNDSEPTVENRVNESSSRFPVSKKSRGSTSASNCGSSKKSTGIGSQFSYRGVLEDNFDEVLARIVDAEGRGSDSLGKSQRTTTSSVNQGRLGGVDEIEIGEKFSRGSDKENIPAGKSSMNASFGGVRSEDFVDSMPIPSNVVVVERRENPENATKGKEKREGETEMSEASFNEEYLNITQEQVLLREIEENLLGKDKNPRNGTTSIPKTRTSTEDEKITTNEAPDTCDKKNDSKDDGTSSDEDIVKSTPKRTTSRREVQDLVGSSPRSTVSRKSLPLRDSTPIARAKSSLVSTTLDISPIVEKSSSSLSLRKSIVHQSTPKSISSSPVPREKNLCFVCTGLLLSQVEVVKGFARDIRAKYVTDFTPEVSHVIVKTHEETKGADITIKYLFGVVHKKWIVGYQWILDCAKENKLLDEEPYEVVDHESGEPGPRRSRLSTTGLLEPFVFLCVQPFSHIKLKQLEDLLTTLDGTVVPTLEALAARTGKLKIILYEIELHDEKVVQHWYTKAKALPVSIDWITGSISQYDLCALAQYLPSENPEYALSLGFPQKLVIDDEDYDDTMEAT